MFTYQQNKRWWNELEEWEQYEILKAILENERLTYSQRELVQSCLYQTQSGEIPNSKTLNFIHEWWELT